jgi:hypothetical protein
LEDPHIRRSQRATVENWWGRSLSGGLAHEVGDVVLGAPEALGLAPKAPHHRSLADAGPVLLAQELGGLGDHVALLAAEIPGLGLNDVEDGS